MFRLIGIRHHAINPLEPVSGETIMGTIHTALPKIALSALLAIGTMPMSALAAPDNSASSRQPSATAQARAQTSLSEARADLVARKPPRSTLMPTPLRQLPPSPPRKAPTTRRPPRSKPPKTSWRNIRRRPSSARWASSRKSVPPTPLPCCKTPRELRGWAIRRIRLLVPRVMRRSSIT